MVQNKNVDDDDDALLFITIIIIIIIMFLLLLTNQNAYVVFYLKYLYHDFNSHHLFFLSSISHPCLFVSHYRQR